MYLKFYYICQTTIKSPESHLSWSTNIDKTVPNT